jgi:L-asparaginase/Glu-tRNA(Gln) amidotransferase subunit D
MRPERFSNSDAPINLGCAIATANLMEKGVFVAMHGIVKENTEIGRDHETGQFY